LESWIHDPEIAARTSQKPSLPTSLPAARAPSDRHAPTVYAASIRIISCSRPEWSITELRTCLERFAAQIDVSDCIALLIDGLDEYDGDLPQLVSILAALRKTYRIKLCVSSRPWNVFADTFRTSPSIRMENLTERDIYTYVDTRFHESVGFLELQQLYPDEIDRLTNEFKKGAQGVFL